MKSIHAIIYILLIVSLAGCAGKKAKVDPAKPISINIPDYAPSRMEVRAAIIAASHSLGWMARDRAPGVVHVIHKMQGRESITLEVDFSETEYAVKYKDSSREAYNAASGKVHPYYESFAKELKIAIEAELPKIPEPEPKITVKPSVSINFTNTAELEKEEREAARKKVEEEKERKEEQKARIARIVNSHGENKATELIGSKEKEEAEEATAQTPIKEEEKAQPPKTDISDEKLAPQSAAPQNIEQKEETPKAEQVEATAQEEPAIPAEPEKE